jgi:hypothetical protein
MTADNLAARARRLDRLVRGFMKEVVLIREADDPLLYLERLAYVEALREAVAGLERGRVTLARACSGCQTGRGREPRHLTTSPNVPTRRARGPGRVAGPISRGPARP